MSKSKVCCVQCAKSFRKEILDYCDCSCPEGMNVVRSEKAYILRVLTRVKNSKCNKHLRTEFIHKKCIPQYMTANSENMYNRVDKDRILTMVISREQDDEFDEDEYERWLEYMEEEDERLDMTF